MIDKPGVYEIDADAYHAGICPVPELSSSIAKILYNRTPRHAWEAHPRLNPAFEPDTDDKFDIGSAGHALMLGDPRKFEIIDAPDWRKKEAQTARDAARAAGKIPLLTDQWARVKEMVTVGRHQMGGHLDAHDAFTNGKPEQTLVWREGDVWLKSRLDWLPDKGGIFDDYKTTGSADPDTFLRQVVNMGYDMQAAFYMRGIRRLGIYGRPTFRFIVQETEPPFGLCVIGLAPGMIDLAERKVDRAIALWAECLRTDSWPCYPTRTCYLELPAWHEAQVLEREFRDTPSEKMLRASFERQAP